MSRRKAFGFAFLGVLSVALFLSGYYAYLAPGKGRIVHPVRGEIVEAVYGLGTIQSGQVYEMTVAVPAVVEKVFVTEGTAVRVRQDLVKLLYRSPLRAPFDGIVSRLNLHPGEVASTREPILTMIDPKDLYALVSLEQRDALRIRENQRAFLSFENDSSHRFEGKVTSLYPREEEFLAKVSVSGLPETVLPGMTLNVSIEIARRQNALLVPAEAVVKNQVAVQRNGHRQKIPVSTGLTDQEMVEIVSGDLRMSDSVVIPKR